MATEGVHNTPRISQVPKKEKQLQHEMLHPSLCYRMGNKHKELWGGGVGTKNVKFEESANVAVMTLSI
jgi:hypothetical protein